jgi:hypothetical protein
MLVSVLDISNTNKMCPKGDSTIGFCMTVPHTTGVTEVEAMSRTEDFQKHEYMLNQRWALAKVIQSAESDPKRAYIHGFDAGIDLLCAKIKLSNPAMAEAVREVADKMAEETAKTLRSMAGEKSVAVTGPVSPQQSAEFSTLP